LQRKAGEKKFVPLKKGDDVYSGDTTIGVVGSQINSADGAVQMRLLTDLLGTSPHPVLEAAVIFLPPAKGTDFDFILDRGRLVVENIKKEGEAHVRIHARHENWRLTLHEPKALVGVELYGRWPRGVFWHAKDNPPETPTAILTILVLNGHAELRHGKHSHAMQAPPGPALYHWDSVGGADSSPQRLEELPEWARKPDLESPEIKKRLAAGARFRARVLEVGLDKAIAENLKHSEDDIQRIAVIAMGATDDLPALVDALGHPEHDVRDSAVMVLRHWIGRGPGQDAKVYELLTKEKKYPEGQAATIMHLLHTPGPNELSRPELWEALIEYLRHDKTAVRMLAWWHLYRLVPEGRSIRYDPGAGGPQRQAAYDQWRKMLADGKLPPKRDVPPPKG